MDTNSSLNYDLDSSEGIVTILAAIRNSNISVADKNNLRDLVFSFTNGGKDEVVRNALENKLSVFKITVPKIKKEEKGKAGSRLGVTRPVPVSFSVKKKYSEIQLKKPERKTEESKENLETVKKIEEKKVILEKPFVKEEKRLEKQPESSTEIAEKVEEDVEVDVDVEIQKAILEAEAEMARLKALKKERDLALKKAEKKIETPLEEEITTPVSEVKLESKNVSAEELEEVEIGVAVLEKTSEKIVPKEEVVVQKIIKTPKDNSSSLEKKELVIVEKAVETPKEELIKQVQRQESVETSSPASLVKPQIVSSPESTVEISSEIKPQAEMVEPASVPSFQTPTQVEPQKPASVQSRISATLPKQPVREVPVVKATQPERSQPQVAPVVKSVPKPQTKPQPQPQTQTQPQVQSQITHTPPVAKTPEVRPEIDQKYLNRIKEIKNIVNSKVGNPVNLIDIDNVAGREYMNALLEAMKKVNGGLAGEIDVAMLKLEETFAVVKKMIDEKESGQKEAVKPEKSLTETKKAEIKPQVGMSQPVQASTLTPQPSKQPQTQTSLQASQKPDPTPTPTTTVQTPSRPLVGETPKPLAQPQPEVKPQYNAQVVKKNNNNAFQHQTRIDAGLIGVNPSVPKSDVNLDLKPAEVQPQSVTPRTTKPQINHAPLPSSAQNIPVIPKVQEVVNENVLPVEATANSFNQGVIISADPMRKVDLGGEVLSEKTEEKVSGFENNSDLISVALGDGDISGFSSTPVTDKNLEATAKDTLSATRQSSEEVLDPSSSQSESASFLDKISPIAVEKKVLTIDDVPETSVVSEDDLARPLYTAEIDQGLDQLLSDWSLFKKSGLFGTGPKGREHPLFKKIAGLQIPLLLAGRFDGVTQEIRQSITDYMNGWRYEQGIVYEQGETFEVYLRRVIKHIIDLQKRRRGA